MPDSIAASVAVLLTIPMLFLILLSLLFLLMFLLFLSFASIAGYAVVPIVVFVLNIVSIFGVIVDYISTSILRFILLFSKKNSVPLYIVAPAVYIGAYAVDCRFHWHK